MKVKLEIKSNPNHETYLINLGDKVKIGRGESANWVIKDQKISSIHCMFIYKEDRLQILDLNSKNGTYLNGIKIENGDFFIGDQLRIGDTVIWLRKENVDPEAITNLTYPGPNKKLNMGKTFNDFSPSRGLDQLSNLLEFPNGGTQLPKDLKKIDKSFDKKKIKEKYPRINLFAKCIDLAIFVVVSIIIFYFFKFLTPYISNRSLRTCLFVLMHITAISLIYYFNFKHMRFSIGEKISGFEKLFSKNV